MPKKNISLALSSIVLLQVSLSHAALNLSVVRGEKTILFDVPGAQEKEVCIIPKHYPGVKYKKSDIEKEEKLCHISFNPVSSELELLGFKNAAVCAKMNSTNPGVNIFKTEDAMSKANEENELCSHSKGKIGKYKNSTSCSHTSSILSYYHISRILGRIANVPVSVLRTMNRQHHLNIAQIGKDHTKDLLNQTWAGLFSILRAGKSHPKADNVLTTSGEMSYGAFQYNPKNEEFNNELFNKGTDRALAFKNNNPYYLAVTNSLPLNQIVKSDWTAVNLQKVLLMKDTTEFIILDYLLDQQDRFGNIASQDRYAYFVKDDQDDKDTLPEMVIGDEDDFNEAKTNGELDLSNGKKPLPIEVMLLKDNDCGVTKENKVKNAGLLEPISHLNPSTYKKIIEFNRSIDANKSFFTTELLMPEREYTEFRSNLKYMANFFEQKCKAGKLHLDLDVDYYFEHGSIKEQSCDVK